LIATPYQSFDPVLKWLDQAAVDDDVEEIKITLYRVSNDSAVAKALIKALEKGKKVIAFIEVQARFDEESNYYWGNKLRAAGAEVLYSIAGIKVHSKIFLIKRREESINKYYAYLGTGNFNEKTAKLYTDYGLLTADDRLTEEVEEVFQLLEKKRMNIKCEHLLVSPFSTRERIYRMIDREIKNAKSGKPAYMVLKMNSLEDTEMINHLYKASQKGVKISLIIRGICRLIPGQTGLSENISCVSIIDRYLEHSRVYIFANGGDEQIFLASADLMTRNLDRRVEVCFPLYDKKVKTTVRDMINLHLNDNVKARDISQSLEGRIIPELKLSLRSQEAIYEYFSVK
jgi:polyphosphate kinase